MLFPRIDRHRDTGFSWERKKGRSKKCRPRRRRLIAVERLESRILLTADGIGPVAPEELIAADAVSPPLLRFDFGTSGSPVEAGYQAVSPTTTYTASAGYGWQSGVIGAVDRGGGTLLGRDLNHSPDMTFAADVPDGIYEILLTTGDSAWYHHDRMGVFLEGSQVDTVDTAPSEVVTLRYGGVIVSDGQLNLRIASLGGSDPNAVISGLEISLDATGPRVVGAVPTGETLGPVQVVTLTFDEAILDGSFTVEDVVALVGPLGPISPTDVTRVTPREYEVAFVGQTAIGRYSMTVGPEILDEASHAMDQDGDGLGGESIEDQFTTEFTLTSSLRFDFGSFVSPVAPGYVRVMPSTAYASSAGYGWQAGQIWQVDRGLGTPLGRDLHYASDMTFALDVPDGDYRVVLTAGDPASYLHDQVGVYLEAVQVDTITTARGQVATFEYSGVRVSDGQLNLRMRNLGGTDPFAVINGLEVITDVPGITVVPSAGLVTTEAGGTAAFTVVLDAPPTAEVTIGISSSDTTEGTVSTDTLTFTRADWDRPQTVTLTGVDDAVSDGSTPYTIVTAAASSADLRYDGLDAVDVRATNTDDDTAAITVAPVTGLITTEAGGTARFTVVLDTQPTADVTVGISSSDIGEGTVSHNALTFTTADWNLPQTVTVTGVDDVVDDDSVAYAVLTAAATSADSTYDGMDASDVTVTNTDDDTAAITVTPTSGLVTTEAGGTARFTVVLGTRPTADVTVGISSSDATEATVSTDTLTFTPTDWSEPQTVTVTGLDDAVSDDSTAYTVVTAPATSADAKYHGLDAPDVALTNRQIERVITPLGAVDFLEVFGQDLSGGDLWFAFETTREGLLTIEAVAHGEIGDVRLILYQSVDDDLPLADSDPVEGNQRIDWHTDAERTYYLKVIGTGSDVDLRLTNLVQREGDRVKIHGTEGDDRFVFTAGDSYHVIINGTAYRFNPEAVEKIEFQGGGGDDAAVLTGSKGKDVAVIHPEEGVLRGDGYRVSVAGTTSIAVYGGGGPRDAAHLYDSTEDDRFTVGPNEGILSGVGFSNFVDDFRYVHGYAKRGGRDVAEFRDSSGDDVFIGRPAYGKMTGPGYYSRAKFFDTVEVFFTEGNDVAHLRGSRRSETFIAKPTEGQMKGAGFHYIVHGATQLHGYAVSGGTDVAHLYDSPENDVFIARPRSAKLYDQARTFQLRAKFFDYVHAYATGGGDDVAVLYGSVGDDLFVGKSRFSRMSGHRFNNRAKLFEAVYGKAVEGGLDRAYLHDSADGNAFEAANRRARLSYGHAVVEAWRFSRAKVFSQSGGDDVQHVASIDFLLELVGAWREV